MHADLLFTNANIYNVFLKTWNREDVAVLQGRILHVGDSQQVGISSNTIIDCKGAPLIPGMIDIHLHVESTLCVPHTFGIAVLQHGTTTIVSEPHEMANIFGRKGIEEMIRASKDTAIDAFFGVPSSVPSTHPELETTGGTIDVMDLKALMRTGTPEVICLGEIMNYSTLIEQFETLATNPSSMKITEMLDFMRSKNPLAAIEGHCPSLNGLDLSKLLYFGIDSDHCKQDLQGMIQRFKNGMFVEIQAKSVEPEIIHHLQNEQVDGLWSFVTDDVPPDILQHQGHLDHVVRLAMQCGLTLDKVIVATSHAPATRMGLRDRGTIGPGKIADLILLRDDSADFPIKAVYKRGKHHTDASIESKPYQFPAEFTDSIRISPEIDFSPIYKIPVENSTPGTQEVRALVMNKSNESTYTTPVHRFFPIINGFLDWENPESQVNLVIVINRYSKKLQYCQGLLDGDKITGGAFCSTYAHDHHNILVLGDNQEDMQTALSWVLNQKGGMCTVSQGIITASVPLPIGGILSEEPMQILAESVCAVQQELHERGIHHENPIMSLCTITLPVSPAIKITDKGLIEVATGKMLPLLS